MKKILIFLPIVAIIASCGTPAPNRSGSGNNTMRTGTSGQNGEIASTTTEYVPIEGRNENGIRVDLEGTWTLQSSPGTSLANKQGTPAGVETRSDTITVSETVNGEARTSTTVQTIKEKEARITPPQSSNPNMHVPEAPHMRFFGSNETVSGFTGCNKFSGRYSQTGRNSISFQHVSPSTKMMCIGSYDEESFMTLLRRATSYRSGSGQLELLDGETVLLTFSRK